MLKELAATRNCSSCPSCTRDACGKCDACMTGDGHACLRRICCLISPTEKALPAAYFPTGYIFYFDKMAMDTVGSLSSAHVNQLDGFILLSPGGQKFYSIESAMHRSSLLAKLDQSPMNLYDVCGIELTAEDRRLLSLSYAERQRLNSAKRSAAVSSAAVSYRKRPHPSSSVEDLNLKPPLQPADCRQHYASLKDRLRTCLDCFSCSQVACGTCDACSSDQGFCLRRICCKLSVEERALPAPFFPLGFRFYFDKEPKKKVYRRTSAHDTLDGLNILLPTGTQSFYSVESILNKKPSLKPSVDPEKFYDYVGITLTQEEKDILSQRVRRHKNVGYNSENLHPSKRLKTNHQGEEQISSSLNMSFGQVEYPPEEDGEAGHHLTSKGLSPAELYRNRCRCCSLCLKEDCGKCETCIDNAGRTRRFKEVCLRKMCERTSDADKQQPVRGFPKGWTFYFYRDDRNTGLKVNENLLGFYLVSPLGIKYRNTTLAIDQNGLRHDRQRRYHFFKQIGASLIEVITNHPLLNEGYSNDWINAHGEKVTVYGKISCIERNLLEQGTEFTVTYSEASRNLVNRYYAGCGVLHVPVAEKMNEASAWGGCLLYQSKQRVTKKSMLDLSDKIQYPRKWLVPDLYRDVIFHSSTDNQEGGDHLSSFDTSPLLPCVLLHYASFELKFVVKTSTIPNAGHGVFLSCRPLDGKDAPRYLELAPGELLDFGVYAPHIADDRKNEHQFLIKSFIHQFRCESYSFDTRDNEDAYDITDDITGDLHAEARRHVPPYVNETNDWKHRIPDVHAMHDPQGALHYLLGYVETEVIPLKIRADGVEREIFIDYGEKYELVRLREGFQRTEMEPDAIKEKLEKDEFEYLEEINTYSANELKSSLTLLKNLLDGAFQGEERIVKLERSLLVLIFLRKRATQIHEDFARPLEHDEPFCSNGAKEMDLEELVLSCSQLALKYCTRLMEINENYNLQDKLLFQPLFAKALNVTFPQKEVSHCLMSNYENPFHKMTLTAFRDLLCTSTNCFGVFSGGDAEIAATPLLESVVGCDDSSDDSVQQESSSTNRELLLPAAHEIPKTTTVLLETAGAVGPNESEIEQSCDDLQNLIKNDRDDDEMCGPSSTNH